VLLLAVFVAAVILLIGVSTIITKKKKGKNKG
jgi:hypothetical protein